MLVDSQSGQNFIAKWSLVLGAIICVVLYVFGAAGVIKGLIFGLLLMLANWRAFSFLLRLAFGLKSPYLKQGGALASYYLTFIPVVIVLLLVIPGQTLNFTVGTFLGFLIPKFFMGYLIIRYQEDEYWLKKCP